MDELGATMIVLREKDGGSWKVVKTNSEFLIIKRGFCYEG